MVLISIKESLGLAGMCRLQAGLQCAKAMCLLFFMWKKLTQPQKTLYFRSHERYKSPEGWNGSTGML
jgi:hypothetical protein